LPDNLKRSETERSSLQYTQPIPFVPPAIENNDRKDHEVEVKLSKKLSETASVFHGGIPEAYIMYLSDCAALVLKKELLEKFTLWKNEESSASKDLILHDVNKPKPIKRVTEKMPQRILLHLKWR